MRPGDAVVSTVLEHLGAGEIIYVAGSRAVVRWPDLPRPITCALDTLTPAAKSIGSLK